MMSLTRSRKTKKPFFNKKGNAIGDTLLFVVFLGIFIYVLLIGKQLVGDIAGEVTTGEGWSAETVAITEDLNNDYGDLWDGLFLFMVFGLWMASIILAFLLDAHPIFYVISILGLIGVFLIAGDLSNTYAEFLSADADMESTATTSFPIANALLNNWLIVAVLIGFSVILVLYIKK